MDDPSPALRELIDASGLSIPVLADKSGINEQSLRRWYYGHSAKLNFVSAGKIFFTLTGKPLTTPGVPLKREFRKKGGKAA